MLEDPIHIDADAFIRYATAKNMKLGPCPICGSGDFSFFFNSDHPNNSLSLLEVDADNPSITDARAGFYLSLECKNCGNSRLFKRKTVSDWIKDNPS